MEDKEKMKKAMEAVSAGATPSAAARLFNVPRTTLLDKISGRSQLDSTKGPSSILTKQEEEHLKNWIIFMADSGFPVTRNMLLDNVTMLIKKMNRKNPFTNNRPGRHWFELFVKRNPEVGKRVAQNLIQSRAKVKEANIRKWFTEVSDYFASANLQNVAKDPARIFNCDESAFFLSPSENKVLAKRGSKNVYTVTPSGERECLTVLMTANAAGQVAPPMVLFKLKTIPYKISKNVPTDWGIGHTEKGWMTGESFYEYITNVFYPWVVKSGISLPVIFFLDGHCSHTTLPLSNFCREKQIVLIALYPNATHILQPMDVAVFRPLKLAWKKTVYEWRNEHQFMKLTKENFCPLLNKALKELNPSSITNGFRKCGLSPFNPDNVDYTKCVIENSTPRTQTKPEASFSQSAKDGHFKYLESKISPSKLKAFNDNKKNTWDGEKSLEGLFTVWKQMRNESSNAPQFTGDKVILEKNHVVSIPNNAEEVQFQVPQMNECPQKSDMTVNLNELPTELSKDVGNFTGFTELVDTSYSLNDISDFMFTDQPKIDIYEVINGTLTKITPNTPDNLITETAKKDSSIFNSSKEDERCQMSLTTEKDFHVIRTIGATPIYLTADHKISKKRKLSLSPPNHEELMYTSHQTKSIPTSTITYSNITSTLSTRAEVTSTETQSSNSFSYMAISTPHCYDEGSNYALDFRGDSTLSKKIQTPYCETITKPDNTKEESKKNFGDLSVPTPFKDALFWPETSPITPKKKVKIPSVITSDRWQIFAQQKLDDKTKKVKKSNKENNPTQIERTRAIKKRKEKKTTITTKVSRGGNDDDWYCRLCDTNTRSDMIQCVRCLVWFHTVCAEVQPNDITFHCIYCNVSFDQ